MFPDHYPHRHARCWARHHETQNLQAALQILLVCRQIHAEAFVLPFSMNDFAFDGVNSRGHEIFLASLRPLQRKAIVCAAFGPQIFYLQSPFSILRSMPNLQKVILFLSDDMCEWAARDEVSDGRVKWLKDQWHAVGRVASRSLHICVSSGGQAKQRSKAAALESARGLEDEMLLRTAAAHQR